MLRIYARVLAAALVVTAAAIALRIPNEGMGLSVLYVGSSCVLAYAGFRRGGRRRSQHVSQKLTRSTVSGVFEEAPSVLGTDRR